MNMKKWSEYDTFKFVELYRGHECLWDSTKEHYRNRYMRQKAIEDIVRAMGREGLSASEIRKKIKNIRTTYNQEIKKIEQSMKSGANTDNLYYPKVKWFDVMNQIMQSAKEPSEIRGNLDSSIDIKLEDEQAEGEEGTTHEEQHAFFQHLNEQVEDKEGTANEESHALQPARNEAEEEKGSSQQYSKKQLPTRRSGKPTRPLLSNVKKPRRAKRRLKLPKAVEALFSMNTMLSQSEPKMEENEAFGRYVVAALDKLSQKEALKAQNDIQNLLTRYRLDSLLSPNCPTPHVSLPSTSTTKSYTSSLGNEEGI